MIQRYPIRKNETLQGWDAADELILNHLKDENLEGKRTLIVNDQFGALSAGLLGKESFTFTDSYVSMRGIELNTHSQTHVLHDLKELSGFYDIVLIQLPKNLSYFEDILAHLSEHLGAESNVICGGMIKHMSPGHFDLLNKFIGTTTTSLAVKKARLIFAKFEKGAVPSTYPLEVKLLEKNFCHHSNLFSREKLDIGTRFFLEHIPQGNYQTILDLGCANGIIGIRAQELNPGAHLHFSDDSYMAILSAQENHRRFGQGEASFHWTNCFEGQPEGFLDLVLCNPPFHQQNVVGDFIALQMFQDAFRSLKIGGSLRVIGNSHLGYQVSLKKIFGNSKILATNQKFIICEALKRF